MKWNKVMAVPVLFGMLFVSACTATARPDHQNQPTLTPTDNLSPTQSPTEPLTPDPKVTVINAPGREIVPQPLATEKSVTEPPTNDENVTFAIQDLAQRLAISEAQIELISYEEVMWRDGSLGCPNPDVMYTQALQEGYLIQLSVNEVIYNYHGVQGRPPFLCLN